MASRNFSATLGTLPPGQFTRNGGGGGGGGGNVGTPGGSMNYAGNLTQTPAGAIPRQTRNVPNASVGVVSDTNAYFSAEGRVMGMQNAGANGPSPAAAAAINRFMPSAGQRIGFGGTQPRFNSHDPSRQEQQVQAFANFGAKADPFRRGIYPTSREQNGMQWAGFGNKSRRLDTSNPAPVGRDALNPNSTFADASTTTQTPFANARFAQVRDASRKGGARGQPVNHTAPYTHLVRKFNNNADLQPASYKGMPIIVYKGIEAAAAVGMNARGSISDAEALRARYTEMTPTLFNYVMASTEESPQQVPSSIEERAQLLKILDDWAVEGVAINSGGGKKRPRGMADPRSSQHGFEKWVNSCVQGEVQAVNPWGPKGANRRCKLYFILKRVPRTTLARLVGHAVHSTHADDMASYRLTPEGSVVSVYSEGGKHPAPFQLIPWAQEPGKAIPEDVLKYEYKLGNAIVQGRGVVIQVGSTQSSLSVQVAPVTFAQATQASSQTRNEIMEEHGLRLINDAKSMVDAGQILMHVNVQVRTEV